jgi:hypothetical protein
MEISTRYVIYELNRVMGSERHLALEKVEFDWSTPNRFDSEEEAIKALVDNKKTHEPYVILKEVYIN